MMENLVKLIPSLLIKIKLKSKTPKLKTIETTSVPSVPSGFLVLVNAIRTRQFHFHFQLIFHFFRL